MEDHVVILHVASSAVVLLAPGCVPLLVVGLVVVAVQPLFERARSRRRKVAILVAGAVCAVAAVVAAVVAAATAASLVGVV